MEINIQDLEYTWDGEAPPTISISSLQIPSGQSVMIFGQSGSGKSTLLGLMCGTLNAQSGSISIDDRPLGDMSAGQRDAIRADHFGIIFQQFNLLPFLNGLENILLPLQFSRRRSKRTGNAMNEAIRLTEALALSLDNVKKNRADQLSIGQQQRVAAARALIGTPEIIIADEPTSALDESSKNAFIKLLTEQAKISESTLVMVSHDRSLGRYFDRTIELEQLSDNSADQA